MSEIDDRLNDLLNNPDELSKLVGMARSISEKMGISDQSSDPGTDGQDIISAVSSVFGNSDTSDDKSALLIALKPYLSKERQSDIDKALKLIRIARIAKFAFDSGGE